MPSLVTDLLLLYTFRTRSYAITDIIGILIAFCRVWIFNIQENLMFISSHAAELTWSRPSSSPNISDSTHIFETPRAFIPTSADDEIYLFLLKYYEIGYCHSHRLRRFIQLKIIQLNFENHKLNILTPSTTEPDTERRTTNLI